MPHTYNDDLKINHSTIINFIYNQQHHFQLRRWRKVDVVRWPIILCAPMWCSDIHCAYSSAAFHGNRLIPLIYLNLTDHTFSMALISGLFAIHKRTSIGETSLSYPCCMRCCPNLQKVSFTSVKAWQWLCGLPWRLRILLVWICAIRPLWIWCRAFREIPIIMHVLYSRLQLSPIWNRKTKRSLCSVNIRCLTLDAFYTIR